MDSPTTFSVHHEQHHHPLGHISFRVTYHILLRIIYLATLITQSAMMDFYLVAYNGLLWTLWVIPDTFVLAAFLYAAVRSYYHLKPRMEPEDLAPWRKQLGDLPMSYITWFLYSTVLVTKICIIYDLPDGIVTKLIEANFFGPNMLATAISLSSIIFYIFILSCHNAKSSSMQNVFVNCIVGSVYLDLLDTTQFLAILREEPSAVMMFHLNHVILAIVAFNFIIPTEAVFILARTHFGKFPYSVKFQFFHKVIFMIGLNVPFFAIRMTVWHVHDHNVSVFLMKNLLVIGLAVKDIHEFAVDVSEVVIDTKERHKRKHHKDDMTDVALVSGKSSGITVGEVEFKV